MGVPGVASGNTNRHGAYTHIFLVVKESLTSSATQTHQLKKQNVYDLENTHQSVSASVVSRYHCCGVSEFAVYSLQLPYISDIAGDCCRSGSFELGSRSLNNSAGTLIAPPVLK